MKAFTYHYHWAFMLSQYSKSEVGNIDKKPLPFFD